MSFHQHRPLAAVALALIVSGCTVFAPPYTADFESMDRLKRSSADKVALAPVQPADPNHTVNTLHLRASPFKAPNETFAKHLEDALRDDLKEISLYDEHARTRIDAVILKNELSVASIVTGMGSMQVDITVTRDSTVRLHKLYEAEIKFESSFAAAVAVPKGQSEYPRLVRALLGKVYSDPAFSAAIARQ